MMVPTEFQTLDIIEVIRGGAEISVCIPDDTPSLTLLEWMKTCGQRYGNSTRESRLWGYAMGRMMNEAQQRPNFLADCGLTKLQEFEDILKQSMGREHSTIWAWKPIYKKMPDLTRAQLLAIPRESLTLILKIPDNGRRRIALDAAAKLSHPKFQSFAETEGLVDPGEARGANLILGGSKGEIGELKRFLEHPAIIEYCGTPNHLAILLTLVAEVQSDENWPKI